MNTCLKKVELDTNGGRKNAFAIELGNGQIGMGAVQSGEHRGILIRERKEYGGVGETVTEPSGVNDGDVLIFCKNRGAALVLLETAARLLAMFKLDEE